MHIEDLTGALLAKAAGIYLRMAFPRDARRREDKVVSWDPSLQGKEVLGFMRDESVKNGTRQGRYTLRLGNERYPFMKLSIEEWVEPGEYFFFVDTHDELEISPGDPDYEAWTALRNYNLQLKEAIESAWSRSRIPTLRQAQKMVSRSPGRRTAIVGENARYEGELVRAFLEEEGFRTTVTDDPHRLDSLIKRKHPDLVVMNSFVGDIPGHVLAEALMDSCPSNRKVVLLVAPMDEAPHQEVHSVIRKPVSREEIRRVIQNLFPPK